MEFFRNRDKAARPLARHRTRILGNLKFKVGQCQRISHSASADFIRQDTSYLQGGLLRNCNRKCHITSQVLSLQFRCGFVFACVKTVHFIMSVENLNIGEETQLSTMEANQRPNMVPEKGPGAEADIGKAEDQEQAEHGTVENLIIGSNDSPVEMVLRDEVTQLSRIEANQQPMMIPAGGVKTDAYTVNNEDQEQAEHAQQNINDTIDNLDIGGEDRPSDIEFFSQEDVSTFFTMSNIGYQKTCV